DEGVAHRIACQFSNPEAIKQCVRCGLGAALLPRMAVEKEIRGGTLRAVPFHTDKPPFFIQVVYHKKKWLSQAMEQWIQSVTSEGGGIV
ncbi:MAG: LysR family transcriptional regulator, partial [Brevibacillus sp.]|nr:LysR family transcriptional regulator [Brevibacillus sp.]